jgi:amino acid adenylation domain-containing protein
MQNEHSQTACIHSLFEAQVERTPEAVAVVFEGHHLTYAALNRRANQLARHLRTWGVRAEVCVGLCLERSLEMVIGLLGVLKAGGAYVPLEPHAPVERLVLMCRQAQLKIVLTTTALEGEWLQRGGVLNVLRLDEELGAEGAGGENWQAPAVCPEQLAYMLYTSGSTGAPKGVMVTHRSVLALLDAFEELAPEGVRRVGTAMCPFGFDVSVWELFSVLCFGGTLHVLTWEEVAQSERWVDYVEEWQVTSAYLPPALLAGVAEALAQRGDTAALERLLVGVEPIPQGVLQRFRDWSARLQIVNGYGPTESTVCATFFKFEGAQEPERRTPIGQAVAGYQVYVVDEHLHEVPVGMEGEIFIGGVGLARGYFQQPALTAERFVPDPFSREPGARLYRSGDRARYRPDGNLEFLGRVDTQVKIRGFRVEPGEIEVVLSQHPEVREAAVVAREVEGGSGEKRLIAHVVAREAALTTSELRQYLKARLPEYMLPSEFVLLEALPLTPHGKVDRRALRARRPTEDQADAVLARPLTPTEDLLLNIWVEVLGCEPVGLDDNFFDLGGHSLLATQLLARIRQTFAVEFSLRRLFELPTLSQLARAIETAYQSPCRFEAPPLRRVAQDESPSASFAQERLWFFQQLEPNSPVYNLVVAYRLSGTLDTATLGRSLAEVVRRHAILRTHFEAANGRPIPVLDSETSEVLPLIDLRGLSGEECERELGRQVRMEAQRPFVLSRGPLLRALVLQVAMLNMCWC